MRAGKRVVIVGALGAALACGSEAPVGTSPPDASSGDAASSEAGGEAGGPDTTSAVDAVVDAPACAATSQSDVAGVHIDIDPSRCLFTLAQAHAGISIGYDVVVDTPVPNVVPRPQDAGNCDAPDGSGLIPFESLAGMGQRYCLCDVGLCPPRSGMPITLAAGRFHHAFTWDGTNWTGPSDTGNPRGPPFPAGIYTLTVSAIGAQTADGAMTPFSVVGTLRITLVP